MPVDVGMAIEARSLMQYRLDWQALPMVAAYVGFEDIELLILYLVEIDAYVNAKNAN